MDDDYSEYEFSTSDLEYIDWWETVRDLNDRDVYDVLHVLALEADELQWSDYDDDSSSSDVQFDEPACLGVAVMGPPGGGGLADVIASVKRLMEIMYRQPMKMSDILIRQGFEMGQVNAWKTNRLWMSHFYRRLETGIVGRLEASMPGHSPHLFARVWFECASAEEVAGCCEVSTQQVVTVSQLCISFLKTTCGRHEFE